MKILETLFNSKPVTLHIQSVNGVVEIRNKSERGLLLKKVNAEFWNNIPADYQKMYIQHSLIELTK